MFTPYSVHGSKPNTSHRPRRSYINGFVRADACTIGKWAFLEGQPVPITGDRDYSRLLASGLADRPYAPGGQRSGIGSTT